MLAFPMFARSKYEIKYRAVRTGTRRQSIYSTIISKIDWKSYDYFTYLADAFLAFLFREVLHEESIVLAEACFNIRVRSWNIVHFDMLYLLLFGLNC